MRFRTHFIRIAAATLALLAGALAAIRVGPSDPGVSGEVLGAAVQAAPGCPPAPRDPVSDPPLVTLAVTGDQELQFLPVVVTGYASCEATTDSTPTLTATMTQVRPGCIALSRDLLRTFTPGAPFDFGDCVVIPTVGVFSVEDTMHERWTNRADIWFADAQHALRWGRREALIARLPETVEVTSSLFAFGPQIRELTADGSMQ